MWQEVLSQGERDKGMSTPRPYYFKNGVVVFYVKEKQVYYNVMVWNDSGLKQFSIDSGKYNGELPHELVSKSQNFGDVIRG